MDRTDRAIMKVIYLECNKNKELSLNPERCARLSTIDILKQIPYTYKINEHILKDRITALATEDYFECTFEVCQNLDIYNFKLLNKGKSFIKEIESEKRAIKFKISLVVLGPVASFIVGRVLMAIFKK